MCALVIGIEEITRSGRPGYPLRWVTKPCKRDQIKMRDYMDRRVTPPKQVTSPTRGSPPLCKQALNLYIRNDAVLSTSNL